MKLKRMFFAVTLMVAFATSIFAVTAAQSWEDFRVRIMWCMDTFPSYNEEESSCLSGAIIGYKHCLEHAVNLQDKDIIFISRLLDVKLFRDKGKPELEVTTFNVQSEGDYYINVANGVRTSDDKTQVSSAIIKLDGKDVISPSDLNQNILFKVIKIHLKEGEHNLSVELPSKPRSFLTIVVCEKDMTGMMN